MLPATAFLAPAPLGARPIPPLLVDSHSHRPRAAPPQPQPQRHVVLSRADAVGGGGDRVVHYFAYFSNMNPTVLGPQSRRFGRRCNVSAARPATLRGYCLRFDVVGLPPDPVFANIAEMQGGEVKGVLLSLRDADFRRVARSEGYMGPGFAPPFPLLPGRPPVRLVDVTVQLDGGQTVQAATLQFAPPPLPSAFVRALKPSRRYVQLAIDGARHRGVDPAYVRDVLGQIEVERGPLGGFELLSEPHPHSLDDRDVTSELFSPFKALDVGAQTLRVFKDDDNREDSGFRVLELDPGGAKRDRRLLYYIPGIDGTGRSILSHLTGFQGAGFEVCSVVYPRSNRETLEEISESLADILALHSQGRPVNIVAESMGAVFALLIAAHQGRVQKNEGKEASKSTRRINFGFMMLLNPATSFARAQLTPLWMSLLKTDIPDSVYRRILGPLVLPLSFDVTALQSPFSLEKLMKANDSLLNIDQFANVLPREVLQHRIDLLQKFTLTSTDFSFIRDALQDRIGMVCCENDRLLPSADEGRRFQRLIPGLQLAILPFGGHTILQDTRFDLSKYIQALFPAPPKHVPSPVPTDVSAKGGNSRLEKRREGLRRRLRQEHGGEPGQRAGHDMTAADLGELRDYLLEYTTLLAPVFVGEERLPPASCHRAVLFISNHTLLPMFDGVFLVERVLRQRGALVQSMASRMVFNTNTVFSPGVRAVSLADAVRFGFKSLNPRSFGAALAGGEYVLLFPGGARESLKQHRDPKYSLHWGDQPEFVRFAALFGAVVVPVSTVGAEDMVRVVVDGPQFQPALDWVLKRFTDKTFAETLDIKAGGGGKAWKGEGSDEDISSIVPPIGVPTGLDRLYFRFGHPIEVPPAAYDDPRVAAEAYAQIKRDVEYGIEVLLERREHDAYRSPLARAKFAAENGPGVHPPAGPGWAFGDGKGGVLGEDRQPPLE